jgi:hypothetical protein
LFSAAVISLGLFCLLPLCLYHAISIMPVLGG